MKSMMRKFLTTAAMVVAMLLSSNAYAQRSTVVVKRNGQTVQTVVVVDSRCETPKGHRVRPAPQRQHGPRQRHLERVRHRPQHNRQRCTTCRNEERARSGVRYRYDPVIHVSRRCR